MPEAKDKDGYPRKSRKLTDQSWFYEGSNGICVMIGQSQTIIPWRKIEAAIRHHHAAKKHR